MQSTFRSGWYKSWRRKTTNNLRYSTITFKFYSKTTNDIESIRSFSSSTPSNTNQASSASGSATTSNAEKPNPYVSAPPKNVGKPKFSNTADNVINTLNNIIMHQKKRAEEEKKQKTDSTSTVPPIPESKKNTVTHPQKPSYARRPYLEFPTANTSENSASPPPFSNSNPYLKKESTPSFGAVQDALKKATASANSSGTQTSSTSQRTYESLAELFEFTLKKREEEIKSKEEKGKKYSLEDIFGSVKNKTQTTSTQGQTETKTPTSYPRSTFGSPQKPKLTKREEEQRTRERTIIRKAKKSARAAQSRPKSNVQKEVAVPENVNPRGLASLLGIRAVDILKKMILLGEKPKSSDDMLNSDLVDILISEFGFIPKRIKQDEVIDKIKARSKSNLGDLPIRAPIVAIMGHINHGKTTLLDAFRNSNVADDEAGKITQKLGAFEAILKSGSAFTFLDTPGHAAFNALRSRGAKITDFAILVVAADEGIKEQTIEAINQIKQSNLPFIVAINKCDKYNADPQRVRTELLNHEIVLEEFGGTVQAVNISAQKKESLEDLETAMLILAEQLNLRADPEMPGGGYVVESRLDKSFGPVATCLIHFGKFQEGDYFVAGSTWGKIRTMLDSDGDELEEAGPSAAIQIAGFKAVPEPGEDILIVESADKAKQVADRNALKKFEGAKVDFKKKEVTAKEIPIILRADVIGSAEAIAEAINQFPQEEVKGKIIKSGVGQITESDIELAQKFNAILIQFGSKTPPKVAVQLQKSRVPLFENNIIYDIIDKLKDHFSTFLDPRIENIVLGEATIQQVFDIDVDKAKPLKIAGCKVTSGSIKRNSVVKIFRGDQVIFEGKISSLKHKKNDVSEARLNTECGISIENCTTFQAGDKIQAFEEKKVPRKLGEE